MKKLVHLRLLCTALLLVCSGMVMAQRNAAKGDRYFDVNLFEKALKFYELETQTGDRDAKNYARQKMADCYRIMGEFELAEDTYERVLKKKSNQEFAENYLNYAQALKNSGKFAEAKEQFALYIAMEPDDPMGPIFLQSCDSAQKWVDATLGQSANNLRLLNSPAVDMAPAWVGRNKLVFSSSRKGSKKAFINVKGGIDTDKLDFYSVDISLLGGDSLGELGRLDGLNTPLHEGPASFSYDGQEVYFTRTVEGQKNKSTNEVVNTLQIFYSRLDSTGAWTEPVSDFSFNSLRYSVAHPSLSRDGQTLYFMSDRKSGSEGGTDIWYVTKDDYDEWGEMENLGPEVNTFGHELFPYSASDGTLYFSSDSHPGMGQLDIFSSRVKDGRGYNVQNMKPPMNSIGNDFGLTLDGRYRRGFFTSDRFNGVGAEDLYSFSEEVPMLFVVKNNNVEFSDTRIFDGLSYKLIDDESGLETELTAVKGRYKLKLESGRSYTLVVKKRIFPSNYVTLLVDRDEHGGLTSLSLESKMKPIEVTGTLRDMARADSLNPNGLPLADTPVSIMHEEETVKAMKTDSRGNFFPYLTLEAMKRYLVVRGE